MSYVGNLETSAGHLSYLWSEEGIERLVLGGRLEGFGKCYREFEALLVDYFNGLEVDFSCVEKNVSATCFQKKVWEHVQEIGYGQRKTYGGVSSSLGKPGGARAVGGALKANPLPIIIPCHRVVSKQSLGGFNQGLVWKNKLLSVEGVL